MAKLGDLADICRSKNAGPYMLTVDFLFEDEEIYTKIKNTAQIKAETVAELYKVKPEQVSISYFDVVKAIKVSVPRLVSSGSRFDTDVFGAQQHTPMTSIEINI